MKVGKSDASLRHRSQSLPIYITEEILASSSAVWFSPTGQHLLYAVFNDSQVGNVAYNEFAPEVEFGAATVTKPLNVPAYPITKHVRYPKVSSCDFPDN